MQISSQTIQSASPNPPVPQLLRMVASLKASNKELTNRVVRLEGLVENLIASGTSAASTVYQEMQQVSSIEDLNALKVSITSATYRNAIVSLIFPNKKHSYNFIFHVKVKWLSVVGGQDSCACVARVTDRLLSESVQKVVNITGAKGKTALQPLDGIIFGKTITIIQYLQK